MQVIFHILSDGLLVCRLMKEIIKLLECGSCDYTAKKHINK